MDERKISRLSWRVWLRRTKAKAKPGQFRISILGVGNELMGDDAAGVAVIQSARRSIPVLNTVQWIEAGPSPESFSGPVCQFKPDLLLVIDAANMGLRPGRIAWIPKDEIDGISAFTHGLPISLLAGYIMTETGCTFGMIGIQADQMEFGQSLSAVVRRAVRRVSGELRLFLQN